LRTDEARITRAYAVLLGLEASPDEIKDARAFLASMDGASNPKNVSLASWSALVQALMASTEFCYAW
jgi:hypothetical protein